MLNEDDPNFLQRKYMSLLVQRNKLKRKIRLYLYTGPIEDLYKRLDLLNKEIEIIKQQKDELKKGYYYFSSDESGLEKIPTLPVGLTNDLDYEIPAKIDKN